MGLLAILAALAPQVTVSADDEVVGTLTLLMMYKTFCKDVPYGPSEREVDRLIATTLNAEGLESFDEALRKKIRMRMLSDPAFEEAVGSANKRPWCLKASVAIDKLITRTMNSNG
jgi:hypothetical protein